METFTQLFISFVGTALAVIYALKQHRSKQFWDEKYRVYSQLILAIEKVLTFSTRHFHEHFFNSPGVTEEETQSFVEAKKFILQTWLFSGWIASPRIAKLLENFDLELEWHSNLGMPEEDYWADRSNSEMELLTQIIEEAQWDLGFRNQAFRRFWSIIKENLPAAW